MTKERLSFILLQFKEHQYQTIKSLLAAGITANEIEELIDELILGVRSELQLNGKPTGDVLCHKGSTATHYLDNQKYET